MIAEDREAWSKLCAMLDAHPEGALHDPESPEWTARDVSTHLAHLMKGSVRQMEDHLAGRPVIDPYEGADEDAVNAQLRAQHSEMTLEEARTWAHAAFSGLISAIEAVPPDRWDDALERYARADGADHMRGHMGYIVE
jgi:hypothetical protein